MKLKCGKYITTWGMDGSFTALTDIVRCCLDCKKCESAKEYFEMLLNETEKIFSILRKNEKQEKSLIRKFFQYNPHEANIEEKWDD
ncbi:MAG: hypothetical protein PHP92_03835 [Candidatus Nanoarchaeia archaeon]|nr:hypothetical protein [Candidatus Nanoarchaeia archaeon]